MQALCKYPLRCLKLCCKLMKCSSFLMDQLVWNYRKIPLSSFWMCCIRSVQDCHLWANMLSGVFYSSCKKRGSPQWREKTLAERTKRKKKDKYSTLPLPPSLLSFPSFALPLSVRLVFTSLSFPSWQPAMLSSCVSLSALTIPALI